MNVISVRLTLSDNKLSFLTFLPRLNEGLPGWARKESGKQRVKKPEGAKKRSEPLECK